jgi:hypothetical protein
MLEQFCKPSDHTYNAILGNGVDRSQAQRVKARVGSGAYDTTLEGISC